MTERIDRIYYFDYTKDIGHYDSIRNFSSEEMSYIGLALSTPKIHVNSSPHSFYISIEGSSRIRIYVAGDSSPSAEEFQGGRNPSVFGADAKRGVSFSSSRIHT